MMRIGVVLLIGSMCTPSMPIRPSAHTTLSTLVTSGSSMPCRLRNDQYWIAMMIKSAMPK